MYRHTQVGRPLIAANIVVALGSAIVVAFGGPKLLLVPVALATLIALLFGRMTVEVDERSLRFRFGGGGWGKEIPRSAISSVSAAHSTWREGIGIRVTRRGMLYNVASGPAVEIELRTGTRMRIGTDEPDRVVGALANDEAAA